MKICIYEHPIEENKIVLRFEEYPLYDYCDRISLNLDPGSFSFNEVVGGFIKRLRPEGTINDYGRAFLIFDKNKAPALFKNIELEMKKIDMPVEIKSKQ